MRAEVFSSCDAKMISIALLVMGLCGSREGLFGEGEDRTAARSASQNAALNVAEHFARLETNLALECGRSG